MGRNHSQSPKHSATSADGDLQNFMKCLMKMFNEEDKGVVFFETVISLKWQKHTYIECIPVPYEHFEALPGYFKVGRVVSQGSLQ